MDDDELARLVGVRREAVNQVCRRLEADGQLMRRKAVGSKIQNLISGTAPIPTPVAPIERSDGLLSEDEVKAAVRDYLEGQGYTVAVAWGHERGIDIEARKDGDRLLIEAKGEVALQPQQANYFVGALGELVQRLADPEARYGLALPNNRQYRGLVNRLPALARERLHLVVFMVTRTPQGMTVEEV